MKSKTSVLGTFGESIAASYLKRKSYRLIEQNASFPYGELDIVATTKDRTLVFVEVKTMRGGRTAILKPEDNLTKSKLVKLSRTASLYAGAHPKLVDDQRGWRIDLVAITLYESSLAKKLPELREGSDYLLTHYENINS
jgi:putative endonuclease